MAADIRLAKANENLWKIGFEHGTDSEKFKAAKQEWLEAFKVVAADRGESVISWENPYDYIMDLIDNYNNAAAIDYAIFELKKMVDALESIGYSNLAEWKTNYEECVAAWETAKGGE